MLSSTSDTRVRGCCSPVSERPRRGDPTAQGQPAAGPLVLMLLLDPFETDARVEKEAASLRRAGFRVALLGWNRFGTSARREVRAGVSVERLDLRCPRGSRWRAVLRVPIVLAWMLWRCLGTSYQALICHELYTWPVGLLMKGLRRRQRVIFDAHEPYTEQIMGILPEARWVESPLRHVEAFLARSADSLVTVSPLMMARFREMGVEHLHYLPNVPQLGHGTVARPVRVTPGRYVIGRIGVISPRYSGIEALLQVAQHVNTLGVATRVVLAGPVMNAWEPTFRTVLARYGSIVEYLGTVPPDRVPEVLATFDLMASLFEPIQPKAPFGYSTKIFDAMALGVPVLTSRTAEDQFLVGDTGCGLVVDYPFNVAAIARLVAAFLLDARRRQECAERGLRAVRTLNWEAYEGEFVALAR